MILEVVEASRRKGGVLVVESAVFVGAREDQLFGSGVAIFCAAAPFLSLVTLVVVVVGVTEVGVLPGLGRGEEVLPSVVWVVVEVVDVLVCGSASCALASGLSFSV